MGQSGVLKRTDFMELKLLEIFYFTGTSFGSQETRDILKASLGIALKSRPGSKKKLKAGGLEIHFHASIVLRGRKWAVLETPHALTEMYTEFVQPTVVLLYSAYLFSRLISPNSNKSSTSGHHFGTDNRLCPTIGIGPRQCRLDQGSNLHGQLDAKISMKHR